MPFRSPSSNESTTALSGELNQVNRRLDVRHGEYTDARTHLDDTLNLPANRADIYARCDDTIRRLCDPTLFTRIYIEEDE